MEVMQTRRTKSAMSPKKMKIIDIEENPEDKEVNSMADGNTLDYYKFERKHRTDF